MSQLLKSGTGEGVRRFTGVPVATPEAARPVPMPDPRDAELARLMAEVERLNRANAEAAEASARAVAAAREDGRRQGLGEAETREADRLAALGKGLAQSAAAFAARLDRLDALAPALVREALAKLFADIDGWAGPVEAALARQLADLRLAAVVAVRVSPQDFPDAEALAGLAHALGIEGTSVEADRALPAGASRIECRLGQVDLDLPDHWRALSALLEDMAR